MFKKAKASYLSKKSLGLSSFTAAVGAFQHLCPPFTTSSPMKQNLLFLWPLHLLFLGKNFSFARQGDKGSRKTHWRENLLARASFQGPWQGSLDRKQGSSGDARAPLFCDCSHMTLAAWCCSLLFAVRCQASLLFLPLLSDPPRSFMQVCRMLSTSLQTAALTSSIPPRCLWMVLLLTCACIH